MNKIQFLKSHNPIILSDTFTRSDSSSLGNAETGQTWLQSTAGAWGVSGGKAYFINTNDAYFYITNMPDAFTLSYVFTSTAGAYYGPRIRLFRSGVGSYRLSHHRVSDGVTGYLCLGSDSGTAKELVENVACASGSAMRIEVTRESGNVRFKIYDDGTLIANVLDSTFKFSGDAIDFGYGFATRSTFDNILIQ